MIFRTFETQYINKNVCFYYLFVTYLLILFAIKIKYCFIEVKYCPKPDDKFDYVYKPVFRRNILTLRHMWPGDSELEFKNTKYVH